MSFYLDRLEAARRQRVTSCYQNYQHAASAQLPRQQHPPFPPLHAGEGGGAGNAGGTWRGDSAALARSGPAPVGAGAGAAGWDAVAARGAGGLAADGALGADGSVTAPPAREEAGGGAGLRNKRCSLAPTPQFGCPPPKRTAVPARRRFPPGCGRDTGAPPLPVPGAGDDGSRFVPARRGGGPGAPLQESVPPHPTTLAGGNDSVVFEGTASPAAAAAAAPGSSALNEVSAADAPGAGATTGSACHRPGAALMKPSEAAGKSSVAAAADGLWNSTASPGVAGPGSGDQLLKNKDHLAPAMRLLPKPSMVCARRRFPTGCRRRGGPLPAGSCGSHVCLPSSEAAAPSQRDDMEIVAPPCSGADGAAQNKELEEGGPASEVRESPDATLHDEATACRHGASAAGISAVEGHETHTSSSEKMIGSTCHCAENRTSGSSCNVAAESLAQVLPKEHLRDEIQRVSECATTADTACSGVAAGISDEGAMMRKKVMFTPRKSVKPPKSIQKSTPFSNETEETELGRHTTNGIEDTDEFKKDPAMQDPMSSDKSPWTKGKEAATVSDYFGPKKKVNAHLPANVTAACALGTMEKPDANKEDYSNLEDDDIFKALAAHEGKFEHGPQNADARSRVKMVCSRFESICRAIVQAAEQRSLKVRRIDLAADKLIRKLPGFTKLGPVVGDVPGVDVGDEFLYRVELALVGLHRPYQGGIDTTRDETGVLIAISVVASGGYPDVLSCPGELIYTGSGKDGGDQKLGHGNLALRNCIERKTPVRVIHGFKGQNREEGSHSRAREISTFTYDGLHRVVDCWREGRPGSKVFKYKLQRVPGQPGLSLGMAKFVRKKNKF
ncbi:hypothetical protein C2845_PM13G11610 [Panicum miliaceum]|uniref:YDG domain-containing protein n=1 Tax=Panicum miliaceum TaxID=4540 RepID=A0A3L6RL13_PANMI|nr:hypothetical protein C2845_PM13G11610 [Panicum miliaceum]